MAEEIILTTPVIKPTTTKWRVRKLYKDLDAPSIYVRLRGDDGSERDFTYVGDTALQFIIILNKANNSIKSEERKILERLQVDYLELAGNITGSPD